MAREDESTTGPASEIKKLLPLAASLGQPILFENVWNKMHYDHDAPPEQIAGAVHQVRRQLQQPLGRHVLRHRQPLEVRPAARVAQGLRPPGGEARRQRLQPGQEQVRRHHVAPTTTCPGTKCSKGLDDIGFTGWTTAEVGGGGLERLTTIRKQMQKAFGLS